MKSSIFGESQTVTWLVPVRTLMPFLLLIEAFTCTGCVPAGGGQSAGSTIDRGGSPCTSTHQKKLSHGRIVSQVNSRGKKLRRKRPIQSNIRRISS